MAVKVAAQYANAAIGLTIASLNLPKVPPTPDLREMPNSMIGSPRSRGAAFLAHPSALAMMGQLGHPSTICRYWLRMR